MTNMLKAIIVATALWAAGLTAALAQSTTTTYPAPWKSVGNTVSLSASGSSGRVQLGWSLVNPLPIPAPSTVWVCNTGAAVAYVNVGGSTVTATTSNYPIQPGTGAPIALAGNQYLATITGGGATTLTASSGEGTADGCTGASGGGGSGTVTAVPSTGTGGYSAVTVTSTSGSILAARAAPKYALSVKNESTTATIAICFGSGCTAAINTAGSVTIPPGFMWAAAPTYIPLDQINGTSSAATSPATIGSN